MEECNILKMFHETVSERNLRVFKAKNHLNLSEKNNQQLLKYKMLKLLVAVALKRSSAHPAVALKCCCMKAD